MSIPKAYRVADHLVATQRAAMAQWQFRWPRQLEIHPPPYILPYSTHPETDQKPCIFDCLMCAGRKSGRGLVHGWEPTTLALLTNLQGRVPFTILSGEYTEPMSSRYFGEFLRVTKTAGGCFGVHTNGARLQEFEACAGGLSALMRLPGLRPDDFISVSVYAGAAEPFNAYTQTAPGLRYFEAVLEGLIALGEARRQAGAACALRVSYLGTAKTLTHDQFARVVEVVRWAGFDSLRMSIAFTPYDTEFARVESWDARRRRMEPEVLAVVRPFLSSNPGDRPYVFYRAEAESDVGRFARLTRCAYDYLQATISARGTFTKCSTVTMSSAHDIGSVTADPDEFREIVARSLDPTFNPERACFQRGLRCDPLALELNDAMSCEP